MGRLVWLAKRYKKTNQKDTKKQTKNCFFYFFKSEISFLNKISNFEMKSNCFCPPVSLGKQVGEWSRVWQKQLWKQDLHKISKFLTYCMFTFKRQKTQTGLDLCPKHFNVDNSSYSIEKSNLLLGISARSVFCAFIKFLKSLERF